MLPEGFVLVHKPRGISSFYVVHRIRKLTGQQKVGHAGTLDPFASGLMILALGRTFTRQIDSFHLFKKTYWACMGLGVETDTLDAYGQIHRQAPLDPIPVDFEAKVKHVIQSFEGTFDQMPPDFSAKKIEGKRAYDLARQNQPVILQPKSVTISSMSLNSIEMTPFPLITFSVLCSTGTYIRSLARDIGLQLHSAGYLKDLVRTHIGPYALSNALRFDDLSAESIQKALFIDKIEAAYAH